MSRKTVTLVQVVLIGVVGITFAVNTDKGQLLESGIGPKIQRLIKKAAEGEGKLGKALETAKKGAKQLRELSKTYNGIAQWVGLTQVPRPLLGAAESEGNE